MKEEPELALGSPVSRMKAPAQRLPRDPDSPRTLLEARLEHEERGGKEAKDCQAETKKPRSLAEAEGKARSGGGPGLETRRLLLGAAVLGAAAVLAAALLGRRSTVKEQNISNISKLEGPSSLVNWSGLNRTKAWWALKSHPAADEDPVKRKLALGRSKLAEPNCPAAAGFFSRALDDLQARVDERANAAWEPTSEDSEVRRELMSHLGFAEACSQRYSQAIQVLNKAMRGANAASIPPFVYNAAGVAYYHLKDFRSADALFSAGCEVHRQSLGLRSNWAAVKIVKGEYEHADEALYPMVDSMMNGEANMTSYKRHVSINMGILTERMQGKAERLPVVDLWWSEEQRVGDAEGR